MPQRMLLPFVLAGASGLTQPQEPTKGLHTVMTLQDVRVPVTAQTVDELAKRADSAYERMYTALGAPTVELLSSWVDLMEYYRQQWIVTPEPVKESALDLSDRAFNGSLVSWGGFENARTEGNRLDKQFRKVCGDASCPDGVKDAARSHLLYHLSAHRAYMVQRALGDNPALAEIPQYWDAYNRLVPIAMDFTLMRERDAYVHAGIMEGQHQLESTVTRGEYDPVAAVTNMQQARWLLERAKTALEQRAPVGSEETKRNASLEDKAQSYVGQATDRFRLGRQFGAARATIRDALAPTLTSGPLEELLLAAIARDRADRGGTRSRQVAVPFVDTPATAEQESEGLVESVLVVATGGKLNPDTYVLDELDALAARVPLRDSLEKHEAVKQLAPLVFHGLLEEIVGERDYDNLRGLYLRGLPATERDAAKLKYPFLGRVVVTNQQVYDELCKSGDIFPVASRLGYVDGPELYTDVADLWSNVARSGREDARRFAAANDGRSQLSALVTAIDASRRAYLNYVYASWRYLEEQVPSGLHLNIGASAQNALAAHSLAVEVLLREHITAPDASAKLRAYAGTDGQRAEKVLLHASQQRDGLVSVVEQAYTAVIERGPRSLEPSSFKAADERFAFYVNAAARLSEFKASMGDADAAGRYAGLLVKAEPANALQYYARGDAREVLLEDEAGARADFEEALELFSAPTQDPRAAEYKSIVERRLAVLK